MPGDGLSVQSLDGDDFPVQSLGGDDCWFTCGLIVVQLIFKQLRYPWCHEWLVFVTGH